MSSRRPWFPGLRLKLKDRKAIAEMTRDGKAMSKRDWRRLRILELLDRGEGVLATAAAVGTYPREVRRVGWRYLEQGLKVALSDDARPKPPKRLDSRQEAAIVAMACAPPPEGYARWTIVLLAAEARRRGVVATVGRETVRRVLSTHELKPWREKNVVRGKARPRVRRADGGRVEPPGEAT